MTVPHAAPCSDVVPMSTLDIAPGTILISSTGQIKIIRSRTKDGGGWNCADGASIDDRAATDAALWTAYTPEQLAADLAIAKDLHQIAGQRLLAGGLATWDACSGRPCQLPKVAKLVKTTH